MERVDVLIWLMNVHDRAYMDEGLMKAAFQRDEDWREMVMAILKIESKGLRGRLRFLYRYRFQWTSRRGLAARMNPAHWRGLTLKSAAEPMRKTTGSMTVSKLEWRLVLNKSSSHLLASSLLRDARIYPGVTNPRSRPFPKVSDDKVSGKM